MANVESIVQRLGGGQRSGSTWKVRCPAHQDVKASLAITLGRDGRVLMKCHAGCTFEAVVAAGGIQARELAPENGAKGRERTGNPWVDSKIVATYDYVDSAGRLVFQTVRFDPKDFRQRRPDGKGGWIKSLDGVELVLYRLPDVLDAARAGGGVYVVEGEKDAEAIARLGLGLLATTSPLGAGKWRDSYSETLRGVHVAILPDKDKAGRAHAEQVAASLQGKAASVRVVELPGDGKDPSDWIAAGGTAAQLRQLVRAAPEWKPGLQQAQTAADWPPLLPLGAGKLPEFPVGSLPVCLSWFVAEESRAIQVPAAAIAMIVLSACAAAVARKIRVEIAPGWSEPLNLYTAAVLPPGERKSQAMRDASAPLEEWEREALRSAQRDIAEARAKKSILDKRATIAQHKASRAKEGENLAELNKRAIEATREAAEYRVPAEPRLLADNVTPEALASLLTQHGGRIALFSAEGGIFDIMAGHYSRGSPNFEIFLKGHSGDTFRVDRKGRPSEHVADPALTMALAIQPDVVQGLSSKPGFRGRGLLGRFLYAVPESLLGVRDIDPPAVSAEAREQYHRTVRRLLELPDGDKDHSGQMRPHVIQMDDTARAQFRQFQRQLEPKLAPLGELGALTDWAGKLAGAVARIAALLHLAELADQPRPWLRPVARAAVERAIEIADFLVAHAKGAYYGMAAHPGAEAAEYILKWLRSQQRKAFTQRELHQASRRRFHRAAELQEPLGLLVESGYIRRVKGGSENSENGRAGRPSESFEVNPMCYNFEYFEYTSMDTPLELNGS